jgi:hypothetical protein
MPISNVGARVAAGEYTSFMISEDNNLYAWGANTHGQVGVGPPELWGRFITKPRLVLSMYGKNVTDVTAGRFHTVARTDREYMFILDFSPGAGPVDGGSSVFVIGQGFNSFSGPLECRFSFYTNGTHTSQYDTVLNGALEEITAPVLYLPHATRVRACASLRNV